MGCYLSSVETTHNLPGICDSFVDPYPSVAIRNLNAGALEAKNVSQAITNNTLSTANSFTFLGISPKSHALMNITQAMSESKAPLRSTLTISEVDSAKGIDTDKLSLKEQINLNFSGIFKLPKQVLRSQYSFSKDYLFIESIGRGN